MDHSILTTPTDSIGRNSKDSGPIRRPIYTFAQKDAWFRWLKASGLETNKFCRRHKAEGCPCPATFTQMRKREAAGEVEEPKCCTHLTDQEIAKVLFMSEAFENGVLTTKTKVARMACLGSVREINKVADNKLLKPIPLYAKRNQIP